MKNPSFLSYILETEQKFKKTIALVAGSFKPPTAAHWNMVQQYVEKADQVIILISDPKSAKSIRKTANGTVITAEMAKKVFDIYINTYGLRSKVKAIVSPKPSPVTAMFDYIDQELEEVNVIMGVSKKDGDEKRYESAMKYYADDPDIHLIDPMTTAVEPYLGKDGQPISATAVRDSLTSPEAVKEYLPSELSDADVILVLKILKVGPKIESLAVEGESDDSSSADSSSVDTLAPLDETECINVCISDDILKLSKIAAYNVGQTVVSDDGKDKEVPYNPKKFPTKAVDIIFPVQDIMIEVFFDPRTMEWDSSFSYQGTPGKLSPDQMGQFFETAFYQQLLAKFERMWPLSDEFYGRLFNGLQQKRMKVGPTDELNEDGEEKHTKHHDRSMSNKDVDDDGKRDYTASGRKIFKFGNNGVSSKDAQFYCWPDIKKLDRWSTWKDWSKIRPLCRMRLTYNGIPFGLTISPMKDDNDVKYRGFRGYDLDDRLPPIQWLTKEENESFMKLSLVDKFIRHCAEKLQKYASMPVEEVMKLVGSDRLTAEEVAATQKHIKMTIPVIKDKQADSFKWQ